jgi:hypothetical protein
MTKIFHFTEISQLPTIMFVCAKLFMTENTIIYLIIYPIPYILSVVGD